METALFYTAFGVTILLMLLYIVIGIKSVKKEDLKTYDSFFLSNIPISTKQLIATLAATNTALALTIFWFSYLGWSYGLGAAFWLSICWILGLELFAVFQKRWRDFPSVNSDGVLKYQTLHEYISPTSGNWARRSLALVSIISFVLMVTVEITRGMRIIDILPFANGRNTNTDIFAFVIVFSAAIYSAYGGFRAVIRTDAVQWFMCGIGILFTALITFETIFKSGTIFGTVYEPKSFSIKDFLLIPTQPYFIIGSLFSWGFWFFVTMDMWQRSAASRSIGVVNKTTRIILYPWFVILTFVSVSIGLYVRVKDPTNTSVIFPVIDFFRIAFKDGELNVVFKWVSFILIFAGFFSAMISTIDTYILVISHSIFKDLSDKTTQPEIGQYRLNRLFASILIFGIAIIVLPIFIMITHSNFSINSLLYMATSLPFILLPAVLLRSRKDKAGTNLIFSVILGLVVTITFIYFNLSSISDAQNRGQIQDVMRLYNYMYLIPIVASVSALIGYLFGFVFNLKKT
jgi:Na+/proline symporter